MAEPIPEEHQLQRTAAFSGRRAAHNSLAILAGQILVVLIAIATTPITLNRLGIVEFGVWGFVTATVGYISTLDPGFGGMVARYGARDHALANSKTAAQVCSLGTAIWLGFGVLLFPLVYLLVPILVRHLHLGVGLSATIPAFFYYSYVLVFAGSIVSILSNHLNAVGDQWLVTLVDVIGRILYAITLVVLLTHHFRLSALIIATTVQYVLCYCAFMVLIIVRVGRPYASLRKIDPEILREVRHFGSWLQLGSILETLTYETDPIIIGTFVGKVAIGIWSVALRLARQITYFAYIPTSTILPAMSAEYAIDRDVSHMQRMYVRANQVIVACGAYFGGFVIACGPLMYLLWFGPTTAHVQHLLSYRASEATIMLTIAMLAGLPRPVTAAAIFAMGKVGYGVRAQIAAFVVNLVLTILLVHPFGLVGVLIGTAVAKVTATTYLLVRFSKLLDSTFHRLIGRWLLPLILTTVFSSVIIRVAMNYSGFLHLTTLGALAKLLEFGVVYTALFAIGLRASRYFSLPDLQGIRQSLPQVVSRLIPDKAFALLVSRRAS